MSSNGHFAELAPMADSSSVSFSLFWVYRRVHRRPGLGNDAQLKIKNNGAHVFHFESAPPFFEHCE
jgi:hypothetical protein